MSQIVQLSGTARLLRKLDSQSFRVIVDNKEIRIYRLGEPASPIVTISDEPAATVRVLDKSIAVEQ